MTLKDLHESWVKTGYPSRTEIRKAIEGLLAEQSQTPTAGLRERIAQITAHRACHNQEQDLPNGKIGGYCIVCGVPWPCQYSGPTPQSPKPPTVEADGEKGLWEQVEKLLHEPRLAIDAWRKVERIKTVLAKYRGDK